MPYAIRMRDKYKWRDKILCFDYKCDLTNIVIRRKCACKHKEKLQKEADIKADWRSWKTIRFRMFETGYSEGCCVLNCRKLGRNLKNGSTEVVAEDYITTATN